MPADPTRAGMDPLEYRVLFDHESDHWWFVGMHAAVIALLEGPAGLGPGARVLDAGCGTGKLLELLRLRFSRTCAGFDISSDAARYWPLRDVGQMCRASINAIPFADATFDGVVSVDVLECGSVDEHLAIGELARVVRPGGPVLVVVPAYRFLFNASHHCAVGAVRRYSSRSELRRRLAGHRLEVVRITHLFAAFLPLVAGIRLAQKWHGKRGAGSDIARLPAPINAALSAVARAEARLVGRLNLPFGSSIVALCRKVGRAP